MVQAQWTPHPHRHAHNRIYATIRNNQVHDNGDGDRDGDGDGDGDGMNLGIMIPSKLFLQHGHQQFGVWDDDVDFVKSDDFFATHKVIVKHGNLFTLGDHEFSFVAAVRHLITTITITIAIAITIPISIPISISITIATVSSPWNRSRAQAAILCGSWSTTMD